MHGEGFCVVQAGDAPGLAEVAARFVMRHEATCCDLVQRVLLHEPGVHVLLRPVRGSYAEPGADGTTCTVGGGGHTVTGATCAVGSTVLGVLSKNGPVVIPCVPCGTEGAVSCLAGFLAGSRVTCVSGHAPLVAPVRRALGALGYSPGELRDNCLMECNPAGGDDAGGGAFRCAAHDLDELLPLHLAFMQEEAAPAWAKPSVAAERLSLSRALSRLPVFALRMGGEIVAKAQVSAESPRYVQVGGVYTLPRWRGNGCAHALMQAVCAYAASVGKKAVLFVRRTNKAALRLYQKAGFTPIGAHHILYYNT